MKRLYLASLLALIAMAPSQLQAKSLSTEEALNLAKSQIQQSMPMLKSASQQSFQLVFTQKSHATEANMVYVFADQSKGGFMIVAADDDAARMVLGYSDTSTFDADNIPPAMSWWLEMCAASVQQSIIGQNSPLSVKSQDHAVYKTASKQSQLLKAPAATRTDIAPIVKTRWGQDAPYNDKCPVVMGQRSVTGCVATATAQVMNLHQWPITGTGSNTYQWSVNGTPYSASLDFSGITFDWAHMTDTYGASSTAVEKDAVAELMYACGVACNMNYTPSGSGASDLNMAIGLLNYFGYDEALTYVDRAWFTAEEWDNILYDQLLKNQPVIFGGHDSTNAGHEFVIDGYSTQGFYHVNWGWDGYCDGYFSISDLNPSGQGTGGGSGESGFNYAQSMLINITRPQPGSELNAIMVMGDDTLGTDQNQYDRNNYTAVYVTGGFFSFALRDCGYTLGLHAIGNNIDEYIPWAMDEQNLSPLSGFSAFPMLASSFPVGEYEVVPAYKASNSEWRDMYINNNAPVKRLAFNVTESTITVGEGSQEERGNVSAELVGYAPVDENDGDKIYVGHSYDFCFEITSTGPWDGNLQLLLIKDGYFYCKSEDQTIDFKTADKTTSTFTLALPQNLQPGEYGIILTYEESNGYMGLSPAYGITVSQMQEAGEGVVSSVGFVGSPSDGTNQSAPAVLYTDNLSIEVALTCTKAPWTEDIMLAFADPNTYEIFYLTEPLSVSMDQAGQTQTLTFSGPWEGVEMNETYLMAVFGSISNQMSNIYFFRTEQKVIDVSSISLTETDRALKVGETLHLKATVLPNNATDPTLTWKSSNENVAKIEVGENNSVSVYAIGEGSAVITATATNGVHAACTITVTKKAQEITWTTESQEVLVGDDLTLSATASSGLDVQYEITKGSDIASLSGNVLHVQGEGEIVITATQPGNEEYEAAEAVNITITAVKPIIEPTTITLSETNVTLTIGEKVTITATITPEDATDKSIDWKLGDLDIAEIDALDTENITITAKSAGTTVITATSSNGLTASCVINVVKKQQAITWVTTSQEIVEGSEIEIKAYASSGLDVTYAISDGEDIATLNGNILHIIVPGKITIVASQAGDNEYDAAQPVSLTIYGISGIANIGKDQGVKVNGNTITVTGIKDGDGVAVYTIDGKCVYFGTDRQITLANGQTYLLRTPYSTYKINIK